MKFFEKCMKLQSIVKKWGLKKKIKKSILADWWKLKCQGEFSRISVYWQWNPAAIGSHATLENWRSLPGT